MNRSSKAIFLKNQKMSRAISTIIRNQQRPNIQTFDEGSVYHNINKTNPKFVPYSQYNMLQSVQSQVSCKDSNISIRCSQSPLSSVPYFIQTNTQKINSKQYQRVSPQAKNIMRSINTIRKNQYFNIHIPSSQKTVPSFHFSPKTKNYSSLLNKKKKNQLKKIDQKRKCVSSLLPNFTRTESSKNKIQNKLKIQNIGKACQKPITPRFLNQSFLKNRKTKQSIRFLKYFTQQ